MQPTCRLSLLLALTLLLVGAVACSPEGWDELISRLQNTPTPLVLGDEFPPAASSDWYRVYFTKPIYPDGPANRPAGLDRPLTAFINTAQKSVDMCAFQLDLPNVVQALMDAHKRGAQVRLVTDLDILNDSTENPPFKQLQKAGIQVVGGNPNAIMHNKFVVVDGAAVWTGSWNFTTSDTYRYDNNAILIQSSRLARNYTATFEKMFTDDRFGPARKPGGTTTRLSINGVAVENYFTPEDNATARIVERLKQAKTSIDFMAFSFTDDNIGKTVRDRAKAGVKVRGVFETRDSDSAYSEYGILKKAGLQVYQDGNPYLMHHKVFILDGQTVILGSFNFSRNANESNDENLLIIDDAALAQAFMQEFERVLAQATSSSSK